MTGERVGAGRRLASLVALLSPVVAVGLLVWILVDSPVWGIVVIVLLQALALSAAWIAVSRAGWLGVAGGVVAVGAVVATLALLTDAGDLLKLLGFVVLWAVAFLAARRALALDPTSLAAAPLAGDPVGATERPVLLMNPWSGGGKVGRFDLVEEARRRGITPIVLQEGDDLLELAEQAMADGAGALGAAGGDGTQALIADLAARHDLPFVCIPAGTRNHFALDLGLNRDNVVGALDAFTDGVERRVDLADVNGRTFVNNCSLGVYARVVQSDEYRDAKLRTAATTLPDLIGPDAESLDLRFTDGRGREYGSTQMLLVANNPYRLNGVGGVGTRARMDTGTLGVVHLQVDDERQFRQFVALQAANRADRFDGWSEWTTPDFEVDSADAIEVGVDGEALRLDPPLTFTSRPGALRVRLPHHAPGRAPAAVASDLNQDTVRRLGQVLVGRPDPGPG